MLTIECLSSGLDELRDEVNQTYDNLYNRLNTLHASLARYMADANRCKFEDQSQADSAATRLNGPIINSSIGFLLSGFEMRRSALAKSLRPLKSARDAFRAISGNWSATASQHSASINEALKELRSLCLPLARGEPLTLDLQSEIAQKTAAVEPLAAEARRFLTGPLQAVREQWTIIRHHMCCLHRDLMPGSEVPNTVPFKMFPMALCFRRMMGRELDIAHLFEVAAIRIQPPILRCPGSSEETGHSLVDFRSLKSSCEKPVAMKVKWRTAARVVGETEDSEETFVRLNQGQVVTVIEGGYGSYWKCTVSGIGKLWIASHDLAL
jgi:hypothetical protein